MTRPLARVLLLGVVQGVTEPLPVSSSAHLLLLRWALGWDDDPPEVARAVDVALHLGTAAGTALVVREELRSLLADVRAGEPRAWAVVLSPLPAALVGGPLAGPVHRRLATPRTTALLLAAAGLAAAAVEARAAAVQGAGGREEVTAADVAAVAVAQTAALVPGVSRTTAATAAARARGLSPGASARLVLLLALPVVTAAGVRSAAGLRAAGRPAVVGAAAAAVTTAAVGGQVRRGTPTGLRVAARYRLAVAAAAWLLATSRRRRRACTSRRPPGRPWPT